MNKNPFLNERENQNKEIIKLGTVETVNGSHWTIQWDGEPAALNTVYSRVESYTPTVGDRVIGILRAETYVILGRVVK